jgi:hypothetical protein
VLPVWENCHDVYYGIQTAETLIEKEVQIINWEGNVNCCIIALCDKSSFLTGNALLLQRDMQKNLTEIKSKMRLELDLERIKQKEELIALKVSSPIRSSNLHHFTAIHIGVDIISLAYCPIFTSLYCMPCILI